MEGSWGLAIKRRKRHRRMGLDWPPGASELGGEAVPSRVRGNRAGEALCPHRTLRGDGSESLGYRQAVAQGVPPGSARAGRPRGPKEKPQ